ncbi:S-adenosyl-L-methionine-dependent methyltransferase [Atractiella rhizophila]|nr:S-adenosyl-L-methionine-dependent methyltransferase [Atractiella rhizophila]
MKLRDLECELQKIRGFEKPKLELEQYVTDAHQAARMLFTASVTYDDIEQKRVLDLGCGCGILSLASLLTGASYVVGVDIDPSALSIARDNINRINEELSSEIDLVQSDLSEWNDEGGKCGIFKAGQSFDTVVMNPPFGTKNKNVDMLFLSWACRLASSAVYSLHKTSTREYISKKAKEFGFKGEVLAEMRYELPKTMKMHKQKSLDIHVDFWRFEKIEIK